MPNVIQKSIDTLVTTTLGEFEAVNAFQLRIFRREISEREGALSLQCLEEDLAARVFEIHALSEATFVRGRRLSDKYTGTRGARSADLLHIAAAIELGAGTLYSFDLRQRNVAKDSGLKLNPLR